MATILLANLKAGSYDMKHSRFLLIIILLGWVIDTEALASQENRSEHKKSKYIGQEYREIKSLSKEEVQELLAGGGYGFAKAAELNGIPGPLHLLELKEKIPLSKDQVEQITIDYHNMKSNAQKLGKRLVAYEAQLEAFFKAKKIDKHVLRTFLKAIADTRQALRNLHLGSHLEMLDILSQEQLDRYYSLRGYGKANPCASVPEGHNAEMWRKHNGCQN